MNRQLITPSPPFADDVGLPWDVEVDDAVGVLRDARHRYGDTFTAMSGSDLYLFTFSGAGVSSFYALPESAASKGVADYRMLRRKLPDEIFDGRRTFPHELFRRELVTDYLANLEDALDRTIGELGDSGEVDLFSLGRRIGHRVGLASWGGPGAASGDRFSSLVEAFDALDGSDAFVHPDAMAAVCASDKIAERRALDVVCAEIAAGIDELDDDTSDQMLFRSIVARWEGEPVDVMRRGVALDVALVHIASLSNLVAALGWLIVDLVAHPAYLDAVRDGDPGVTQQVALESIRLAQRSIMARYVLAPVTLDVGDETYSVAPGVTVATLLPLTNVEGDGYAAFVPERWHGRRLDDVSALAARELVTAFGHGSHTCPAQSFSLTAMGLTARRLFTTYDIALRNEERPVPVGAQIGGVARASLPCPMLFARRTTSP